MKKMPIESGKLESVDVVLLLAVTVGLGIVLHGGFFLVAAAIAVIALASAAFHAVHHLAQRRRMAHKHS